ncbi:hypothetical protein [Pontibacter sp. H249]|uniref:hypothetical protein n=1 Tax=Pontibacter sp. H249 TaxID=3133420 RepID=UPI0030BDB668
MKNAYTNYSNYAAYLTHFFGREPSPAELISFENNQNLILINRRSLKNNAFQFRFVNGTALQLLPDEIILGGSVQLHSQEAGHRFYSVMFEEQDTVEEHYLILDATVESVVVNAVRIMLVQSVRLITIEDLVLYYNPIMYNLT